MEGIMIKEAAKMLGVEAHVLRYWEEELGLEIKRNSMGHRYYDERDIKMFNDVKELKSKGLTLKDIRQGIDSRRNVKSESVSEDKLKTRENSEVNNKVDNNKTDHKADASADKEVRDFREITVKDNDAVEESREAVSAGDGDKIVDFKLAQMQTVMNKVIANALRENRDIITTSIKAEITEDVMKQFDTVMREQEERQEARYRKLDECLRQIQQANEEVAATKVRRRFGRRK